jgi:hypothetical protein
MMTIMILTPSSKLCYLNILNVGLTLVLLSINLAYMIALPFNRRYIVDHNYAITHSCCIFHEGIKPMEVN